MTDMQGAFLHWLGRLAGKRRPLSFFQALRVLCLPLFLAAASLAQAATVTFTSSGNWTAPTGVTSVTVEAWGGGGAGGGATGNPAKGGGGAGGQYASKVVSVIPGNTYAIVVGAGGVGGTGNGPAGGSSTFAATAVVAKGGAGGTGATNGVAGIGSSAGGVADVVYAGGSGSSGDSSGTGGAGGGGAGSAGAGGAASGLSGGAGTANSGGNGGDGLSSRASGNPGSLFGGGGGGGYATNNTDRSGGSGGDGQVVLTYVTAPFSCTPPANIPVGLALSCVCDTFERSMLNPSTIFGSNWIVSTSDSTGILPSIVNSGYLRLTNNTGNNAKAATVPGVFPAAGNYISVEFQQYAYNGTGADGIAVTLSDYAVPAVPGAYGGSLGYAQETGIHDGFAGGWLGVALDEYGNYQNTNEGRLGGPGFTVQSVGARGSGSGQSGYRWLGGTNSLSPKIDNNTSTSRSLGYYYQVIVDARNDPASTAVAVNRDTGSGYTSLINIPNVYAAATAQGFTQAPVPANWQVSFTGSTGGSTNIHEISGLRICAQTVVPPTGGTASGFNAIDDAYGTPPAVAVQNYQTGHIYMKVVGQPFKLNVAALNNNQIQTAYVVSGTKSVTVNLVDNSDGVCVIDSTKPNYCSAACKAKTAVTGGNQTLSFAPSNAGQKQSANFTLNTAFRNLVAIISDGTTTACSTDAFSVRPASIAAVVSLNATNGAVGNTGGTPVFKAASDNFSMTLTTTGVAGSPGGYTGVAKIDNALVNVVAPATVAGVVTPAMFPAAISATPSSTATGTTFTYSEVGAFVLPGYLPSSDATSPRGVYDGVRSATECNGLTVAQCDAVKAQTWTGIDSVSASSDCVPDSYSNVKVTPPAADAGKYGCNFGLAGSTAGIGRFVPYEFRVVSPALINRQTAACSPNSTFSYLDEGMGLSYALEARSATGSVTRNYAGGFAKLVLPADGSTMDFSAAVSGPPFVQIASNRIAGSAFAGAWPALGDVNAGKVAVSGTVTVSSLTTPANNRVLPDGPFTNAKLGIAPVDSDGVRIMVYDFDSDNSGGAGGPDHLVLGTTNLYFGEARLLPAIGSERLPLAMRAEVLRWNGAGFVPNGDDSCTQIPAARLGLSGWTKNLGVGETTLPPGALTFSSGLGLLKLSAPGAGNDGSVRVTANLSAAGLGYLAGRWGGAAKYDQPPSAIAAFGLYKGPGPIIHLRENY